MKIDILTSVPDYYSVLDLALIGGARKNKLIDINIINLHDFGVGVHKSIDDCPNGGGSGMIMLPEVAKKAVDSILQDESVLVIPTARGYLYTQENARELKDEKHLIFLNSRFEGYDERIVSYYKKKGVKVLEFSIGNFVLFGSDIATLTILESTIRLLPGVLGNSESLETESFGQNEGIHDNTTLLEYDSFTRPASWEGIDVPEVLLNGNHKKIDEFRKANALQRTKKFRPDIL
ncbi:MAG: tRNA (guanosine(37)-N1)-methyltransferase TrmD [Bifidobacteriaceae bacterium]|jgi:tRNA (guanine37-N1)-methyltransferase|nr:tRNA (guanosine(37)-N1)-methyltransferase TrmD [Bifidobacteriaceae bacterium]